MDHEAEYEKLISQTDSYDELLRMGHVVARVAEPEHWREQIKAKARADKIKVRTGVSSRDDRLAWAYLEHLERKPVTGEEAHRVADQLEAVPEALDRASLRGHKITRVIRAENSRAAAACPDCGARLYVDWTSMPPLIEGEVFEIDCSGFTHD